MRLCGRSSFRYFYRTIFIYVCVTQERKFSCCCSHKRDILQCTLQHLLQHTATLIATHCNTHCSTLQHTATLTATHCNTHCNTLQHSLQHTATLTATHCKRHVCATRIEFEKRERERKEGRERSVLAHTLVLFGLHAHVFCGVLQ